MQKNILNRWTLIILSLTIAILLLINDYRYYTNNSENNNFFIDSNVINLGLDLRGGSEYLLSPKIDKWLLENNKGNNKARDDLASAITGVKKQKEIFKLPNLNTYLKRYGKYNTSIDDLFPGETIQTLEESIKDALSSNKDIIRRRIDTRGVVEPSVRVNGDRISVEIPGDQSVQDIENLITTSAALDFNQVSYAPPNFPNEIQIWQQRIQYVISNIPEINKNNLVEKIDISNITGNDFIYIKKENVQEFKDFIDLRKHNVIFDTRKIGYFKPDNRYNELFKIALNDTSFQFNEGDLWIGILDPKKPDVSGENVSNASVQSDGSIKNDYTISLEFDDIGSSKWGDYTGKNIGKQVAITLDSEVLTYPVIQSRIDGASQITGFDNYQKASNVTIALNNGKFNLPLQIDSEHKTGPELGEKMISLGLIAFFIGIGCVIIFMIIYYRVSGLIASTALLINVLLMCSILSLLGATLTLPGIAGFILTVGIAVDANVIIFERIKEELRKGTPPLSSIEAGYDRAFITILDANVTTLLTAFILYSFGTGPIKGFAITLGAGILCSMFTAIYVTRTIFGTLYYSKFPKKLSI